MNLNADLIVFGIAVGAALGLPVGFHAGWMARLVTNIVEQATSGPEQQEESLETHVERASEPARTKATKPFGPKRSLPWWRVKRQYEAQHRSKRQRVQQLGESLERS